MRRLDMVFPLSWTILVIYHTCPNSGVHYRMYNIDSNPTLANCILWGNTAPTGDQMYNTGFGSPSINYSIIQYDSVWPGTGNLNTDPRFLNPVSGNLRLWASSPAIDAGDNSAVLSDSADLDGDGNTREPTPIDLDGNARFIDLPDTPDTGSGTPPIVDMGAYEHGAQGDHVLRLPVIVKRH